MSDTEEGVDANIDHGAALSYWSSIDPDVNGMLGGYPQISRVDLQGSANFLAKLRRLSPASQPPRRAVDCGAGIGRITKGCLSKSFEVVDIVEPVAKFTEQIRSDEILMKEGKVGEVYTEGLETWSPKNGLYDVMWNQWCLGQLTDEQLVAYLRKSVKALKRGGWIIVKENNCTGESDIFDGVDNSVTRTDDKFRELFQNAGLTLVRTELQTGFAKRLGLFPVRFYALQPGS
ncbi:MAG: Alpha N-terminal protein methyltransferase 1 [Chaenotheca gracillima]|nr:MAG: Alpha N-terminal protein methyltransferase 1 [Chaenotheca gracillima]